MQDFISLQREVERQFPAQTLRLYPNMNSHRTGFVQFCLLAILSQCWPDAFEKPHKNLGDCLLSVSRRRREAFDSLCDVASKTQDDPPRMEQCQMSTCMVNRGCTDELSQFPGVINCKINGYEVTFFHPMIRSFLAAVHFIQMPAMSAIKILTSRLFELKNKNVSLCPNVAWTILYFFGASEMGLLTVMPMTLQHLIGLVCVNVDGSQPVQDDLSVDVVLLTMRCAFEAQDPNLCRFIDKECLTSHTFVMNVHKLDAPVLTYYTLHTTQQEKYWTVYCSDRSLVRELGEGMKRLGGVIIIKGNDILASSHKQKLVFSTRSYQYLQATVKVFQACTAIEEKERVFVPTFPSYGYQTTEQYKSKQQMETSTYFNYFKDAVQPLFQLHSSSR